MPHKKLSLGRNQAQKLRKLRNRRTICRSRHSAKLINKINRRQKGGQSGRARDGERERERAGGFLMPVFRVNIDGRLSQSATGQADKRTSRTAK